MPKPVKIFVVREGGNQSTIDSTNGVPCSTSRLLTKGKDFVSESYDECDQYVMNCSNENSDSESNVYVVSPQPQKKIDIVNKFLGDMSKISQPNASGSVTRSEFNMINQKLDKIVNDTEKMQRTLNKILSLSMSLQKLPQKVQEITNFTETWFPFSDLEKIYEFEVALEDENVRNMYCVFVKNNLKPNAGKHVRKLMKKLFNDEVLLHFSMKGIGKKKSFTALKIYKLFYEAAITYYGNSTFTRGIEDIVTLWLNNGSTRMKQSKRRRTDDYDSKQDMA